MVFRCLVLNYNNNNNNNNERWDLVICTVIPEFPGSTLDPGTDFRAQSRQTDTRIAY
jgi:hypothetical protein